MAVDIGASFKIAAGVTGQQALDKLNSTLGQTQGLAKNLALGLAGIGSGIGLSVLKGKFDDLVSSINRIKDSAEKTGSAIEKFGGLAQAAKITGADIGLLETGIIKMNKALAGSDDDTKGAARALDAIGLSIEKLRRMDPADAFSEIAKALGQFEESGGKTAVVMDIFGKNGAQLLPFMNDYVEVGDQISRVTKEQADLAEEYERNTLKLAAAKQELYKIVSMQVLPVANAFVKALLEVNQETGGVRNAVKGLAQDGTMTSVFKEAARAAAAFLDILSLVGKGVAQLIDSIKVVTNDIVTVAQIAIKAPGALFRHGGVEELKSLWAARGAFTEKANADMAARWGGSATPFTDSLERQFANMGKSEPRATRSDGLRGYKSSVAADKPAGPSAFDTELASLGREAAKYAWQADHITQYEERITSAREAQVRFDIEQGKFKDLSEKEKTLLLMQAEAVDRYAESLRQAKEGLAFDKQTKAIEAETRTLTMNTAEKQIALAVQDLENRGIREGTELFDKLIAKRKQAIADAQAQKGDWFGGFTKGMKDYGEEIADIFGNVQKATTRAFKGMEDALVEFTMTGKLNFNDLALSIIKDLVRIQVQQSIMKPIMGAINGATGGGGLDGALSSLFGGGGTGGVPIDGYDGGGYTGSGARAGGLDGKGGFLAMLHPQEQVVDNYRGQGAGGGVQVNVTVNADTGATKTSTPGDMGKLGSAIGAAVRAEIINQRRPGGLLYA